MTVPSNELQTVSSQQVFTSVPTQEDVQEMNDRLMHVRRNRGQLVVAIIFLCGIIAAGIFGMFVLYGGMNQSLAELDAIIVEKDQMIESAEAEIVELEASIADKSAEIASFADFQTIKLLQDQADETEASIAELLAQSSRSNAPDSLTELPEEIEWRDDVVNALSERLDALELQYEAVEAWPPPASNPRPD